MLPSNMNIRIGKVIRYNNKILISSPSFKIVTNLKINLDGEKDKPDVKSNIEQKPNTSSNKEHKPDIKLKEDVEPNTGSNKEHKPDIKRKILNLTLSSIRSPKRKKRLLWYWE